MVDDICKDKGSLKAQDCYKTIPSLPISLDNKSFELMAHWSWLSERVESKRNILKAELDEHKNMFRYIRDGRVHDDNSPDWHKKEYENIYSDFEDLRKITEQIEILNNKLNLCYKLCSAYTRQKTEEALKNAQIIKMGLLSKRPILAGPEIEKLLLDHFEKDIPKKKYENALKQTYVDYFSGLQSEISKIDKFLRPTKDSYNFIKTSRPIVAKQRQENYLNKVKNQSEDDKFINEFLGQLNWRDEVQDPLFRSVSCGYYQQYKDHRQFEQFKDISLDTVMLLGPFVAGPMFRFGVWGLRGAKLAKWGIRKEAAIKVSAATGRGLSAAYFIDMLGELKHKKAKCESKLNDFYQSGDRYQYYDFKKCSADYQKEALLTVMEASFTSIDGSIKLMKSLSFLKKYDTSNKVFNARDLDELKFTLATNPINGKSVDDVAVQLKTQDRGNFYVLNVNESNQSKKFKGVSEDYWNFVADIYNQRLNLSPEEIKAFIKSSNEMSDRTTLVLNTSKSSIKDMKGGVALVTSSRAAEKMPFEKATGLSIPREKGKRVAEVVRLTVGEKDPKLMQNLLDILMSSVEGEKDIDKLYVYTSKVHGRLYKRLGVPMKQVASDKRDVVFEIDVNDYRNSK
jgi:hypothetical protein